MVGAPKTINASIAERYKNVAPLPRDDGAALSIIPSNPGDAHH